MRLEEAVELVARPKTEEAAQLGPSQPPSLIFCQCESFERAALDLACAAEQSGEFVGDSEGDFHRVETTQARAAVKAIR